MRSVRSLRVLLAFGVGLMALTAGLAEETAPTTTETTTDLAGVVAPEPETTTTTDLETADGTTTETTTDLAAVVAPEPETTTTTDLETAAGTTEVTTTQIDPDAPTETTDKPAAEDGLTLDEAVSGATDAVTTATSGTENPVVDSMIAATEGANVEGADPALEAAAGITETVKEAATTTDLTTQVTPEAPTVTDVADTASDVAENADSLGTGAIANQFSNSEYGGVATAAQVAGQVMNSGLVDPNLIKALAGPASPELSTGLNALKNGAEIASGLSACQASIDGNEAQIQSSLLALGTGMVNSDTITGASALGQSVIKAWSATSGQEADPMYQLFRIYLDQQGNTGKALTTAQESAYSQLTPQCNAAFDDIVETYNDSRGTVSSLMAGGKTNVTCSNYKNNATLVDMTLCVWPSAIWTQDEKIMANITATFTNYGVQLCDVSFFVLNLDKAIEKSPVWLPAANAAFPNGIPQGAEVPIMASVPWSQQIAQNAPIVDIHQGWSACPNGRVAPVETVVPTPRPTAAADPGVMSGASSCFLTPACQAAIAPYTEDECGAYAQLLSSGCSTCATNVLLSAQASCLKSCAATYCHVPGHTADKGVTSGAGAVSRAFAFGATLAAAVAAVLAF